MADGSAFIFDSANDSPGEVKLTATDSPTLDTTPIIVNTAFPNRPSGLRAGQTLTLQNGGQSGVNFEAVDVTLNIEGGCLGEAAGAARSEVNISGGTVGRAFHAIFDSEVNISGGTVGDAPAEIIPQEVS